MHKFMKRPWRLVGLLAAMAGVATTGVVLFAGSGSAAGGPSTAISVSAIRFNEQLSPQ